MLQLRFLIPLRLPDFCSSSDWQKNTSQQWTRMARPVQESYFRLTFRLVPMSKRHVWIHYELVRFLVQLRFFGNHGFQPNASSDCNTRLGQRSPGAGKQHGLAGPRELFSPHFSPGAGVKTSRLNPLRTRKVFAPASVLDPTSVTWFLQFQRLTKKHVATVNPHGQAGRGKLFSLTFRLVPMSKRHVWIHYELVRFLVQLRFFGNHGFQPNASSDCNTRLGQRSPGAGKQHGLAGPRELFSPHFSPGAGVKTSRLNPLRTRKVFAPASVLDPTSVTWFLQFQRLTKKHVATVNPHGQAGPGKLFSPHFSPGSDVKTSRLNPLRTSKVFGPASVLWKP